MNRGICAKFFLILVWCISAKVCAQPLSGQYSVGTGGDFPTIQDAVDALDLNGVSGPVVFDLNAQVFDESVYFPSIPGSSSVNTIVFRGQPGTTITPPSGVTSFGTLWQVGGSNYVFRRLTFLASNVSLGYTIELANTFEIDLQIDSCRFFGSYLSQFNSNVGVGTSLNSGTIGTLCFLDNLFYGVSRAVLLDQPVPTRKVIANNNTVQEFNSGIHLENVDSVLFSNNLLSGNGVTGLGVFNDLQTGYVSMDNNRLEGIDPWSTSNGIFVSGAQRVDILNNFSSGYTNAYRIGNALNVNVYDNQTAYCQNGYNFVNCHGTISMLRNNSVYKRYGITLMSSQATVDIEMNKTVLDTGELSGYTGAFWAVNNTGGIKHLYNNILEGGDYGIWVETSTGIRFTENTVLVKGNERNPEVVILESSAIAILNNMFYVDSLESDGSVIDSVTMIVTDNLQPQSEINGNGYYFSAISTNHFASGDVFAASFADHQNITAFDDSSRFMNPQFIHNPFPFQPANPLLAGGTVLPIQSTYDFYSVARNYGYPGAVEGSTGPNVSVNNAEYGKATVFPNPVSDILNVEGLAGNVIRIFDLAGKCLMNKPLEQHGVVSLTIPREWPNGVYIILDRTGFSKRFIIQR